MAAVEVVYYAREKVEQRGSAESDLSSIAPDGVAVSTVRFQLYFCLTDFAFRVARAVPRLQGSEQQVELEWRPEGGVLVPVLRLGGPGAPSVAYPLNALRGSEVVPEELLRSYGQRLLYVVRPSAAAEPESDDFDLEPVGEDVQPADVDVLTVRVPTIPVGPAVRLPEAVLGASYRVAGELPVILPWLPLRRWAKDLGRRLRSGWIFLEEGLLGAGMVFAANGSVVNVVRGFLPAQEAQATAGSVSFTPATYRHHAAELEWLGRKWGAPVPLSLSAWAHTHNFEGTCENSETDCPLRRDPEGGEEGGPKCCGDGLVFSSMDLGVHKASYQDPWAVAVVLDAAAAARIGEPSIADADRLFAVFGWSHATVTRRSAYLETRRAVWESPE